MSIIGTGREGLQQGLSAVDRSTQLANSLQANRAQMDMTKKSADQQTTGTMVGQGLGLGVSAAPHIADMLAAPTQASQLGGAGQASFEGLNGGVGNTLSGIGTDVAQGIGDAATGGGVGNTLSGIGTDVAQGIGDAATGAGDAITSGLGAAGDALGSVGSAITGGLSSAGSGLAAGAGALGDAIGAGALGSGLAGLGGAIAGGASSAMASLAPLLLLL